MNIVFWVFIWICFCYINYKILYSDIKWQIIPNRLLIYLIVLILWIYSYEIFYYSNSIIIWPLLYLMVTIIICFILFHLWIWSAWDAKYYITLSLFIPNLSSSIFLWNIAIVVFLFLFVSYLNFYINAWVRSLLWNRQLGNNITVDIKDRMKNYFYTKSLKKISFSIIIFFIIFISIRTYKAYSVEYFISHGIDYRILLSYIFLGLMIWVLWYTLYKKNKHKIPYLYEVLLAGFIIVFLCFFSYEFLQNREDLLSLVYKILTFYFIIFLCIRLLKYSINIYTWQDYYLTSISRLQENDILERTDFNKKIIPIIWDKKRVFSFYNIPLHGNIILDKEMKWNLTSLLRSANKHNKKLYKWNSIVKDLKCMKVFAFAPYIFIGFIITYMFQEKVLSYLFKLIIWIFS
jgi:Flp pilus assembly protein protease CpaA